MVSWCMVLDSTLIIQSSRLILQTTCLKKLYVTLWYTHFDLWPRQCKQEEEALQRVEEALRRVSISTDIMSMVTDKQSDKLLKYLNIISEYTTWKFKSMTLVWQLLIQQISISYSDLILVLLEPKLTSLWHQYRVRPACRHMQSDQAL